jgi:murein L,D-transpeptidase YcbB/YkuD
MDKAMSRLQTLIGLATAATLLLPSAACNIEDRAVAQPFRASDQRSARTVRDFAADHGIALTQQGFVESALEYARAQHGQRLDPTSVNEQWAIRPEPYDADHDFTAASERGDVRAWLQSLAPLHSAYASLLAQHRKYGAIVDAGGWPSMDAGALLREGDHGSNVGALRRRLSAEGYATDVADSDADLFDETLTAALVQFQETHGLAADGVAGPETVAALNESPQQKLRTIELNMERLRWLPRTLPATRIEVNIPTADLTYYENDRPRLNMRVIVGTRTNMTPNAIATIGAVTLNPAWKVPASIARSEILPLAERDPNYLASHGYADVDGRLVQAPGPENALGRLKFEMPNPFDVYLHDTSSPQLFARARRTLSHGCVRVEHPRELAEALLGAEWPRPRIDATIETGETQSIPVPRPVPVFLLYQTVVAQADGGARFAEDVYGWDAELDRALANQLPLVAQVEMEPETMCKT